MLYGSITQMSEADLTDLDRLNEVFTVLLRNALGEIQERGRQPIAKTVSLFAYHDAAGTVAVRFGADTTTCDVHAETGMQEAK